VAKYNIILARSVAKEIENIPQKKQRQQIVARIAALADDPRPPGSLKLTGREAYRIRQGKYRIVYTIQDDRLIVHIVNLGHRKEEHDR
jgi:mRNA interferase RelE/StbE